MNISINLEYLWYVLTYIEASRPLWWLTLLGTIFLCVIMTGRVLWRELNWKSGDAPFLLFWGLVIWPLLWAWFLVIKPIAYMVYLFWTFGNKSKCGVSPTWK